MPVKLFTELALSLSEWLLLTRYKHLMLSCGEPCNHYQAKFSMFVSERFHCSQRRAKFAIFQFLHTCCCFFGILCFSLNWLNGCYDLFSGFPASCLFNAYLRLLMRSLFFGLILMNMQTKCVSSRVMISVYKMYSLVIYLLSN